MMEFLIVTKNKTKIEVSRTLLHEGFKSRRARNKISSRIGF